MVVGSNTDALKAYFDVTLKAFEGDVKQVQGPVDKASLR